MFAAPLYLLLLAPWAAVVWWLLSGAHQRVEVPFLEFWSRPVLGPKVKRALRRPPMALVLVCLSMLLAILAASTPVMPGGRSSAPVTIIIDRGITMSAMDGGESRRDRLIDQAAAAIPVNPQSVRMIFVPGSVEFSTASDWVADAKSKSNAAVDTHELLQVAIADALRNGVGPVLVLSDQPLDRADDRLIQISPQTVPRNVSIMRIAASDLPKPQVMLGLRNQSPVAEANVTITSGTRRVTRLVPLRQIETEQDFFFDLPALADTIEASVDLADDLAIDNHAYLVRQRTFPVLEPRTEVSPELRRMIEVYQKRRPAAEQSTRVAIFANQKTVPTTEPAIDVIEDGAGLVAIGGAKIETSTHPITANVDWSQVQADGFATPPFGSEPQGRRQAAGGEGWSPILKVGSLVLVAVREHPSRQVVVSFSSARFAQSPAFVIFWANVFDWVGGGGADAFVGEAVKSLGVEWGLETPVPAGNFEIPPGVYRRGDGMRRAMNMEDVKFDAPVGGKDWRGKVARFATPQAAGGSLRNGLAIAALGVVLLSVLLWQRSRGMLGDRPTPLSSRV
jgi:hypothetical protein